MKHLLWTGGWDSTFRLLDLVLNKKQEVQPYYIIDTERPSYNKEIDTMKKIKKLIFEKDKKARKRIQDTIMIEVDKIPTNRTITNKYDNLKNVSHLGNQYDFLTRYLVSQKIEGLELSIHKDDKATKFIEKHSHVVNNENDSYYIMQDKLPNEALEIFSYYRFPLLNLTKLEMGDIAKQSNFKDIMEETWFCHNPINDKPCGFCNPCKYTREEGLGRRVPNNFISFVNKANSSLKYRLNLK